MNKIIATVAISGALVMGGFKSYEMVHADKAYEPVKIAVSNSDIHNPVEEVSDIKEFQVLAQELKLDDYDISIATDNDHKRIIILTDKQGHKQYKSIFIKRENRIKVIDFNGGLIVNKQLDANDNRTIQNSNVSEQGQGNRKAVKHNQYNRNNYHSNNR